MAVKYLRYPVVQEQTTSKRRRAVSITLVILVLIVPSIISAVSVVRENNFSRRANTFIAQHKMIGTSYVYQTQVNASASTIEFFLAGETLTDADRKLFLADAMQAGFDSTAIVLHEDALTADDTDLRQEQLIKDLFATKDEQIQAYQQQISELRSQLAAAERMDFQTEQLTQEIRTQYPAVETVTFAVGEHLANVDGTTRVEPITLVSIHLSPKKPLARAERDKLQEWLRIRLGADTIEVIIQ